MGGYRNTKAEARTRRGERPAGRAWRRVARRRAGLAAACALGCLALAAALLLLRSAPPAAAPAPLDLRGLLGGEGRGFLRVGAPRALEFPADHGPHPGYRSEWWYFTGNLLSPGDRRFGFQLTFFRLALAPRAVRRVSAWATNQVYLAHFAVTDIARGRFHSFERMSRAALGLAGAQAAPFRAWLEDWSAAASPRFDAIRLRAASGAVAIDLRLAIDKPFVAHGDAGMSRKSSAPGNASYYYSNTRMPVAGSVRIGDAVVAVQGLAWLDREWGSTLLAPDQVGWDWFALQLDDGRELMVYRLRRRGGGTHPFSAGTLVDRAGRGAPLGAGEVTVRALDHWRSPRGGTRYPSRWRVDVPAAAIELEVRPYLADQEMNHSVRYWEGAVSVRGRSGGRTVRGSGYVELTGYGD